MKYEYGCSCGCTWYEWRYVRDRDQPTLCPMCAIPGRRLVSLPQIIANPAHLQEQNRPRMSAKDMLEAERRWEREYEKSWAEREPLAVSTGHVTRL